MKSDKQHRENLEILATHLDSLEDTSSFGMAEYVYDSSDPYGIDLPGPENVHKCGTVFCAAGYAAVIGTKDEPKLRPETDEEWDDYLERVFGVLSTGSSWQWLFGGAWEDVDNTPQGAAKRIRIYLEQGVPDNWEEQIFGIDDLMY